MNNPLVKYRPFTINVVPIRAAVLGIQNNCNGVSFYNAGNTIAMIGGFPLLPLQGWTPFEPNGNEIDITSYDISFNMAGVDAPSNYLLIIRKSFQDT